MRPDTYGRIAGRAQSQLGLITTDQLVELEITEKQRRHLVASGRWERTGRRVLRDRASPASTVQRLLAAVLDTPGAVLTEASAAWLVGLDGFRAEPAHVLVKRGGNHRSRLAVIHETFWLPPHHARSVRGVPCVSDARLAFELAPLVHPRRLRRIVDRLKTDRDMTYEELALTAAELWRRGKPGSAEMRLVVDERMPGYAPPASELEALYRDLCEANGLPQGIRQVNAGGDRWIGRVDVLYPYHRLIVELDSRRWHDTSTAFDDDRSRDNALVVEGWRVIRITWRMLHDEPTKVVAMLRDLLGAS